MPERGMGDTVVKHLVRGEAARLQPLAFALEHRCTSCQDRLCR